jgi:uncharacterized protein (TIGR00730 family)
VERVCVFCGSSPGARPAYSEATAQVARLLVGDGLGIVYGGGHVGLMGVLADTAMAAGGEVIGVMPQALVDREIGHERISELRVVGSMHERKAVMAALSDAFVALPGGAGTLEELFEVYTWAQLGLHDKPCGLLDVEDYFAKLAGFLDHAVQERFVRAEHRAMLMVERDPRALIDRLRDYEPRAVAPRWIDREQT